ncbi:unnamed protein product [Brassica napus]|uniref:(rape) hypothetical protein n=1 Tax=Brassica napus TaxID=3708 RepID=A0A816I2D9_BRANA|nr:unnamed protein product [Brassica napus]
MAMMGLAQHKKNVRFLILLLFCMSIIILLLLVSETTHSLTKPGTSFRQNPPFTFLIKVLTFNRLHSLSRCLKSLSAAKYGVAGHTGRVHLHVYIDHFSLDLNDTTVEDSLRSTKEILDFVVKFEWRYGEKLVHYRTGNAGLQGQWLEAWWPSSDHEFAFVVEDDLEVSPLYYWFLERVIRDYYYDASNVNPSIYGASLQRPWLVPGENGNKLQVTDEWYRALEERIWTPWFIKFVHSRGYFNIYTNFPNESALSVSHRDAGVNNRETVGPDSQLLNQSFIGSDFLKLQPLTNLKWYDYCFSEVVPGSGSELFYDLARRGHPVIDADMFIKSKASYTDSVKEAYVVEKCLQLGYSTWVFSSNVLLVDKGLLLDRIRSEEYDFYIGESSGVLIVQSSLATQKLWSNELMPSIVSSATKNPSPQHGLDFIHLVKELLEQKGKKVKTVETMSIAENINVRSVNQWLEDGLDGKPVVYWSHEVDSNTIQTKLVELDLWLVDDDLSCKAVIREYKQVWIC